MTREEAAKACPDATAFIAEMREAFGEIKVLYVAENGHTFGKKPDGGRNEDRQTY